MSQLQLFFLGTPRIERDDQVLDTDTRKATALLAYLALTGERQSRDSLAALLWPEYDDSRGKAALRRTLSALKSAIGGEALFVTRELIGLDAAAAWCDALHFQSLLAHDPDLARLETAVTLYRDDFLAGFSLRDSIPFDDWQLIQAQTLRRDLETALEKLIKRRLDQQEFTQALPLAHRWLALDPLREDVHRLLMQVYTWLGQPNAALRQYRDCLRILDEELGVPPLPETSSLYEAIHHDRLAMSQELSVVGSAPILPPAVPPPLIGRAAELVLLRQMYDQVGPNGRFLAIEGEAGIGKTRLAETFLDQLRERDSVILSARCYAGETNLAYAPLIQMLRDGLTQPEAADRLTAVAPSILAEAARLLPELDAYHDDTAPASNAPGAQSRFFDSVGQVLAALLAGPVPGVIWLDDAHWLDSASLDLLLFLGRRWRQRPYLLLLAWRSEELAAGHPLHQVSAEMRREGVGDFVHLARFTPEEVTAVLAAAETVFPAELPARLYAETEGLPYFVVEYLVALDQKQSLAADDWEIPLTVRDLLHNRLAQVSEAERQLLQTAAAIGHVFTFDLVQTASGRSEEESLNSLENLVARGILVEATAAVIGSVQGVYDFSHEKLRTQTYEEMSLARRRLLHRRLAEALTQHAAHQPQPAAWAGQIAGHYHLAGRDETAADYFKQAGDYARSLFAHRDALAHYQMALALGFGETAVLHEACGDLYTRLGEYSAALNRHETAAALAPSADLGRLEHKLAQVYQRQGEWLLAEQKLVLAQQHLGDSAAPATLAQLTIDRSLVAHRQKRPDEALALAEQARTLAEAAADGPMLAQSFNSLGMLARSRGELATAVSFLKQSYYLADDHDRPDIQIAARNNLALALSACGQPDVAQSHLEAALVLCQRYGDRHREAALRNNLADVLHQVGDEAAAQEQVRQSVTIYSEIGRDQATWQAEIWKLTEW